MITFYMRIHKFSLLTFFLFSVYALQGQIIELSEYYNNQIEKEEFTFEEKESLVDSLVKLQNITIDEIKLAQVYYSLSVKDWRSNLNRSIYYANKIQKIADKAAKAKVTKK